MTDIYLYVPIPYDTLVHSMIVPVNVSIVVY